MSISELIYTLKVGDLLIGEATLSVYKVIKIEPLTVSVELCAIGRDFPFVSVGIGNIYDFGMNLVGYKIPTTEEDWIYVLEALLLKDLRKRGK